MDFSLPVPTPRRAPFRHRSFTVHTTVQTHAIDRSSPFNGRGWRPTGTPASLKKLSLPNRRDDPKLDQSPRDVATPISVVLAPKRDTSALRLRGSRGRWRTVSRQHQQLEAVGRGYFAC